MIQIKDENIRIQVSKKTLEEVLDNTRFHVDLKASKHWKKEFIDIKLIDNELVPSLKTIKTITISNGLHPDLPTYKYECIRYTLNDKGDKFIFQLGDKILPNNKKATQLKLF